ncbi:MULTISPECIES: SseB family protein [unclassified Arthrobacter]|uniref:SseB family protein n=1 Tax=unclassified Arthrobacter TaxID=235627 RepID=UPI001C85263F|nr:SseB family protein [Arthrobacter sp. MAHUQ-56]MBX7444708.1 SseB family protein [Arthrobacter sp. MAHUQ-56]
MTEQQGIDDTNPLNDLEEKLATGGQPDANPVDVILSFLNSEVYIISPDTVETEDSQVEPLVLANADGDPVLAVFSHPSRVDQPYLEAAPNVLGTQGAAIIANIGDELGLVINPGAAYGFEINPEGVANIRRDFKRADEE